MNQLAIGCGTQPTIEFLKENRGRNLRENGQQNFKKQIVSNENRNQKSGILNVMTRLPEYLNSDTEELNETRFHLMIKFENDLFRILFDTGATHSYVGKELLEKILNSNYSTLNQSHKA